MTNVILLLQYTCVMYSHIDRRAGLQQSCSQVYGGELATTASNWTAFEASFPGHSHRLV